MLFIFDMGLLFRIVVAKVVFFICIVLPFSLFAQDKIGYADTLNRVDVNRSKLSTSARQPMPSQTLQPAEWSEMNSVSVADAVKYFSGVQVRDYGGIGGLKTIDVRTLGANHNSVLYDGIPVNNAQNGQVDLGNFSLDNIGSLSLYQGQPSTLLLPAKAFSSASVLLLETKEPQFSDNKKTNLRFGLKGGSFGVLSPSLTWEQKLTGLTSLRFNTEYMKAHGEYDFYFRRGIVDTLVRRENSDIESLRLELGLQGYLPDSSEWKLRLYHYFSERGLPGAAVDNRFFSEERQLDRDYFIQGNWKKVVQPWYKMLISAKHQYSYQRYSDPNFLISDGFLINTFKQNEIYLSMANLFVLSEQVQASISADYLHSQLDANLRDFAYPTRNTFLLNAAAEWRWNNLHLQANTLATFWNEKAKTEKHHTKDIGYSFSMSWKPLVNHNLYIRAFHKSIFRAPTFNDMYYTFVGSTALKPEYVDEYNIGFTWQKALQGFVEYIEFKGDAYHNSIRDRITAIPMNSLFRWSMVNLGKVQIDGLDIALSGKIRIDRQSDLKAGFNYTYQKAIDKTPNGTTYNQLVPYSPKHSGAFFASVSRNKFSFNYNALYTGERYSLRSNIMENLMPEWLVQNVSASYHTQIGKGIYRISAELNNFADRNYQIIRSYPMPGMHYRIGLQVTF